MRGGIWTLGAPVPKLCWTERVFRQLATQGNKLVFGATFSQMVPMVKVARAFPNAFFECCAAITTSKNMASFDARNYEATYLAGVVAGSPNTPVQGITAQKRGAWSVGNGSDFSKYVPTRQLTGDILDWSSA